jgi:hypothetical protein
MSSTAELRNGAHIRGGKEQVADRCGVEHLPRDIPGSSFSNGVYHSREEANTVLGLLLGNRSYSPEDSLGVVLPM